MLKNEYYYKSLRLTDLLLPFFFFSLKKEVINIFQNK